MSLSKSKWLCLTGAAFGSAGGGWVLWATVSNREWLPTVLAFLFLAGLAAAAHGLWRERMWALWLGRVLAAAAFAFGVYLVHFAWTFWLFEEPTLEDRIGAVLRPQVSIFAVIPVLWLIMSFNFKKKGS